MTAILGIGSVVPKNNYLQSTIMESFSKIVSPDNSSGPLIERIHGATGVKHRNLTLPLEEYNLLDTFGKKNDAFISNGTLLAVEAIEHALAKANLNAEDIDLIISTSVTGIAVPSLDCRLVPLVGFKSDIKRLPLFGLGCAAGVAGMARVHDYLLGNPDGVALLLSVELCSLTFQSGDLTTTNVVASGLFGDGAAALIMCGTDYAKKREISSPTVVSSTSRIYEDSEEAIGWDISEAGFHLLLSPGVPDLILNSLKPDVEQFLQKNGLSLVDISTWICHPGGPKILEIIEECFGLDSDELAVSWASLAEKGNLSSASVLHILDDTIFGQDLVSSPTPGTYGLMIAMGPGFCTEFVLLKW